MSPRWPRLRSASPESVLKLLDGHLFSSMEAQDGAKSFIACSCGKKLNCDRAQYPERVYRKHLAEVIAEAIG